ncbi:MAG: hypothetical protein ACE5FT_04740 [Candidatus Nanoarchaeia archaeon]
MDLTRRVNNRKGFTFLEAILGSVMLAGVVVGIYGTYHACKAIHKYANAPVVEQRNVIRGPEDELFADIKVNGVKRRFYAEINAKPVEAYLLPKKN